MNKSTSTQECFLAFRIKASGELAHIRGDHSDGYYLCPPGLSRKVFKAESEQDIIRVLVGNTPSFNTSPDRPSWGQFNGPDDLEVVEVEVQTHIRPCAQLEVPLVVKAFHTFDLDEKWAASLSGGPVPGFDKRQHYVCGHVVALDKMVGFDTLQENVGKDVYIGDIYVSRHLAQVLPVPDELKDVTRGREAALVLTLNPR